jgi:hypothetical protein
MRLRLLQLWIRRLNKLGRLSWRHCWLLLQAVSWLGLARLAVLTLPMPWITPYLGRHRQESPHTDQPGQGAVVKQVAWAVQMMSRCTPWDSNCLAQAIAAKRMLQRRKISSTLYLGVARKDAAALEAHAWLRSGTVVVTGAQGMDRSTVITTFAAGEDVAGAPKTEGAPRPWLHGESHS